MMRLETEGSALADALRNGVAGRGSGNVHILKCALLEAEDGLLRVTTTDLEAVASMELPAKVADQGCVCADAALLAASAREGILKIAQTEKTLGVTAYNGGRFRIPTQNAADFPMIQENEWVPLKLDPASAGMAIGAVACCAAKNDVRHYLEGIGLRNGYIAASDGHTAAVWQLPYEGPDAIVPLRQIDAFATLLHSGAEISALASGGRCRMLRVRSGAATLIVRLIDGSYPDVLRLFPSDTPDEQGCWAIFDRAKLLHAIKQFMPFASTRFGPAAFLKVGDGAASLVSANQENVENASWALGKFGGSFEIELRLDYLARSVAAMREEKVRISLYAENGALSVLLQSAEGQAAVRHRIMRCVL